MSGDAGMDALMVAALIALPVLGTFAYAGIRGAPWVPTFANDVDRFRSLAQITKGERFYDLGCGDGRIVRAAAGDGAIAIGFECSLLPYLLAKFRVGRRGRVCFADFWNVNLSDANVVYCYLMPKVYPRLRAKLERELRPGARVILYVWPMEGWSPMAEHRQERYPPMFAYRIDGSV